MEEIKKYSDLEIIAEFKRRFVDAKTAAELIGYEKVSSVNTLVHRGHLTRHKIAPRFAVYSRSAVEKWADDRPGKGGRPKKD